MNLKNQFEDNDSFVSKLIRKKAHQLVRRPGFSKSDREDIEQELRMELIVKSVNFDPKRARDVTFIARVIERKAVSLIRTRQAKKRHFRRNSKSLNEIIPDGEGGFVELGQMIDANTAKRHAGLVSNQDVKEVDQKLDIDTILETLPSDLKLLAAMLKQMSEHAVSRVINRSRRQVAKDVARLRQHFEDAVLRVYLEL